jgi:hypothetical protein
MTVVWPVQASAMRLLWASATQRLRAVAGLGRLPTVQLLRARLPLAVVTELRVSGMRRPRLGVARLLRATVRLSLRLAAERRPVAAASFE